TRIAITSAYLAVAWPEPPAVLEHDRSNGRQEQNVDAVSDGSLGAHRPWRPPGAPAVQSMPGPVPSPRRRSPEQPWPIVGRTGCRLDVRLPSRPRLCRLRAQQEAPLGDQAPPGCEAVHHLHEVTSRRPEPHGPLREAVLAVRGGHVDDGALA